jgi:hypothetical protein
VPLLESAASGDHLATLRDLRDHLAEALIDCDSKRDVAALAGRLQAVLDQISALEPKEPAGDGIDEIARRRAARRSSTAARQSRAERSG